MEGTRIHTPVSIQLVLPEMEVDNWSKKPGQVIWNAPTGTRTLVRNINEGAQPLGSNSFWDASQVIALLINKTYTRCKANTGGAM